MSSAGQVALVLGVLFLTTFTRSAFGFGDALLAMPLLTLIIGIQTATPLVALVATTISLAILVESWRSVDLKASWRLVLSSILGIPLGLWLLRAAPESIVKAALGVLLIGFGLYQLIRPRFPALQQQWPAYLFGLVAGVLGGAYNTNGPPVIIYGTLRRWSPERFRATLQSYFFPTGLFILAGHGLGGLWTPSILRLYLYSLPVLLLAVLVGSKVNRIIPGEQFHRAVYAFLIVVGVFLFI
jgi:uncharacterized membrane protein YfcA